MKDYIVNVTYGGTRSYRITANSLEEAKEKGQNIVEDAIEEGSTADNLIDYINAKGDEVKE